MSLSLHCVCVRVRVCVLTRSQRTEIAEVFSRLPWISEKKSHWLQLISFRAEQRAEQSCCVTLFSLVGRGRISREAFSRHISQLSLAIHSSPKGRLSMYIFKFFCTKSFWVLLFLHLKLAREIHFVLLYELVAEGYNDEKVSEHHGSGNDLLK